MNQIPLRYRISSWHQLPDCLSNNSRRLHLHVTDFVTSYFSGLRISIEHDSLGVLFAVVLNSRGELVNQYAHEGEPTTKSVLGTLERFGFYIEYDPYKELPGNQIEYLVTVRDLGFDKLRIIHLQDFQHMPDDDKHSPYIVVFNSSFSSNWLNNDYCPTLKEFTQGMVDGQVLNLSEVSYNKKFRWDWLTYVANIDDIIREQSEEVM